MKAPFSAYLSSVAPAMKALIHALSSEYDYISILSTDTVGFNAMISQHQKNVSTRTMFTERGNCVRVAKDGLYSEFAFNDFDPADTASLVQMAKEALSSQRTFVSEASLNIFDTPLPDDTKESVFVEMEAKILPSQVDMEEMSARLQDLSDLGMQTCKEMIDCTVIARTTHVSKMFLTKQKDLRQSYVYSEGAAIADAARDNKNESAHESISGRVGAELFDNLEDTVKKACGVVQELLHASRIEPGEYDVITAPEVSGLIAHEAFGHGVEMDMFVKGRARGAAYLNKRVGSDLVTMHEGAACADSVSGYAFDDEGIPASDVTEIEKGILKSGICDTLSALRLQTKPTGNGKRESFAHKAYTRMTNTIFDGGTSTLDEMIGSISHGYLLRGMGSGMEDPKHWGIQCIVGRGYEIKDGALSGKVVAPVVLTGYVPDLLQSISMASKDIVVDAGTCGKGYKEWVKVADGGPYLKARARLG